MATTLKEMIKRNKAISKKELAKYESGSILNVSRRNKKLVPNEETAFIIWNLPAIRTCPFACPGCKGACYARKAEIAYPDVLPARWKNFQDSLKDTFVTDMTRTILSIAKGTNKRYIIIRIHESGDFYNKEYTNKWLQIMENCKCDKRIKFIAYTKSFPYFDGKKLPKNFAFRASIWSDMKQELLEIAKRNKWNVYSAVEKFAKGDKFTRCRCKDCATCKKCWQNYKVICCEIH